jgi:phospholipid/cholesterol/gamma-HCH transport system substrate-binding protein
MRRIAAIVLVLAATAATAMTLGISGTSGDYRVDALFDNADYLIAGQDVKIAGARVGQVEKVALTRDRKARVELRIDPGFAPFRANAECRIRPQSLIGEKFVECEPGDPSRGPLAKHGGDAPTVPVAQTHSPVDLDVVFTALRLPLRQRLSIVVNELGAGLVGRPKELNAAIRRANPALQQARRTLTILHSERHTLARLIDASDHVVGELAARRGEVAGFIDRAAAVSRSVASRRGDLDLAVHRLPPLLAELRPASTDLTALATDARPVVRALGQAAPQVRALLSDFGPLSDAARPTLVKLDQLSRTGLRAVKASLPVARLLDPVARRLPPLMQIALPLVRSLRDKHVIEALGPFAYYGALSTSRFDKVSHILPSYQISGPCQQYAEDPAPSCNAHFAAFGKGGSAATAARARAGARGVGSGGYGPTSPAAGPSRGGVPPPRARGHGRGRRGRVPDVAQQALDAVTGRLPSDPPQPGATADDLLDWLLQP